MSDNPPAEVKVKAVEPHVNGKPKSAPNAVTAASEKRHEAAVHLQRSSVPAASKGAAPQNSAAALSLTERAKAGALEGLMICGKYVAAPALIWIAAISVGVLPVRLQDAGSMLISFLLVVLAIPLSLFLRLDNLMLGMSIPGSLAVALCCTIANFAVLGAARKVFKQRK